ncbi:MAG: TetR/AcrR family transcriptional regulator [Acidimicrobiia bacterium]|nr:TetR/AcrR family transcriptional regulator [Acidimicrobiia bacterium]
MNAGHRRNRKGEGPRLRDDLLDAVTELLARSGDAGAVTIRAVAARAGVSPPAVYLHFPDRDSLLRTAIGRRFDEFSARLTAVTGGADPDADVLAAAHAYVAFGQAEPGTYRALFSTVDAGPGGLGLSDVDVHPGASALAQLVDLVTAALDARADRRDPWVVTVQLWTALHGLVDLSITKPEIPWPDPHIATDDLVHRLGLAPDLR